MNIWLQISFQISIFNYLILRIQLDSFIVIYFFSRYTTRVKVLHKKPWRPHISYLFIHSYLFYAFMLEYMTIFAHGEQCSSGLVREYVIKSSESVKCFNNHDCHGPLVPHRKLVYKRSAIWGKRGFGNHI